MLSLIYPHPPLRPPLLLLVSRSGALSLRLRRPRSILQPTSPSSDLFNNLKLLQTVNLLTPPTIHRWISRLSRLQCLDWHLSTSEFI